MVLQKTKSRDGESDEEYAMIVVIRSEEVESLGDS